MQNFYDFLGAEVFEDGRCQFYHGNGEIQHDTPENLEEEGVEVPHEKGVPETVREPDIEHRTETLQTQDINQQANHEAARGKSHAADHIKNFPETPGE